MEKLSNISNQITQDMYVFCKKSGCKRFEEAEKYALRRYESAWDAAFEMQNFVDECPGNCENPGKCAKNSIENTPKSANS